MKNFISNDPSLAAAVLETLDEGVVLQNKDGSISAFNSQACTILGLSSDQLLGKTSYDPDWKAIKEDGSPFPGEEHPAMITLKTGKPCNDVKMGVRKPSGELTWISINSRNLEVGGETMVLVTFYDITELMNASSEVEMLKDRLILAAKAGGVGLWEWVVDTDELIWDVNMYRLYQVDPDKYELSYGTWRDGVHKDDLEGVEGQLQRVMEQQENFDTRFRIVWPNGEIRHIRAIAKLFNDANGKPQRLIGTNWDITEETHRALALKASEEQFKKAFTYSSIGIALVNPDATNLRVNEALCEMLGYTESELLNMTFQELTHPEDRPKGLRQVKQLMNGEIDSYQVEKRYIHKRKHIKWAFVSVSLVQNEDGSPKFFISQILDITTNKNLVEELERRNVMLQTTSLDLEKKINQLEDFNHIIAHNLRGPAGSLMQMSEFISGDHSTEEDKAELIGMIGKTAEAIISTLDDLKEVISIQMADAEGVKPSSFEEVLKKVEIQLHSSIQESGANIIREITVADINYPRSYVENILYNLISNSIKYRKDNTIPEIRISTHKKKGRVLLTVSDNGIGIDMEKHGDQIFKYKKVFHKGYDSSGIGLFIVKNQIESFGGRISVDSKKGVGTTFTVIFY